MKKKEKRQITNIRRQGDIPMDPTYVKIISEYYEQPYANFYKMDNSFSDTNFQSLLKRK